MSIRKWHNKELGYIAERMNPHIPGQKVVIYEAVAQGLDVGLDRYAVVCDAHATIVGVAGLKDARYAMENPAVFCEECNAIAKAHAK